MWLKQIYSFLFCPKIRSQLTNHWMGHIHLDFPYQTIPRFLYIDDFPLEFWTFQNGALVPA